MENLSICTWFRYYSQAIWNRLHFANITGIRLSETTLTQNFVFDFWLLAKTHKFPIDIYEAKNEKVNGNDLEILIETDKGYLLFPCQAKAIQNQNRYSTINHRVGSIFQIELLVNYAERHGGVPIYLFYNYCNQSQEIENIQNKIAFPVHDYGLSVVKADHFLQNHFASEKYHPWKIPKFRDLHPEVAIPFHQIICSIANRESVITKLLNVKEQIRYYTRDEIESHPFWKNLAPRPRIGYIVPNLENAFELTDSKTSQFKPKFRLIFRNEERRPGIYILG